MKKPGNDPNHPGRSGKVTRRTMLGGLLAAGGLALYQCAEPAKVQTAPEAIKPVIPGLDALEMEGFAPLAGRKVGLITNHTGLMRDGRPGGLALKNSGKVDLRTLFSPEHGFAGALDQENIGSTTDPATDLPVHSLYGQTRKPTPQMLQGLDTLVFDIQDIGTRFYTYLSTMTLAMQAAGAAGLRFVLLDRPNPIGGLIVEGPLLDEGAESFVGIHPIPVRHGMTLGEMAMLVRTERSIPVDLRVIMMKNWRRNQWWDQTSLTWVNPSPNMRSLSAAAIYPGLGLWEMTNLSVGRGTATPFEWFGAPWIDGPGLARKLNDQRLAGVLFEPAEFTPSASKYASEPCKAVAIRLTDRQAFRSVRMGLAIARQLKQDYPGQWQRGQLNRLLGRKALAAAIERGDSLETMESLYQAELAQFMQRRQGHLLYP